MNIEEIKRIINLDMPDEITEQKIIDCLASDENIMFTLMRILESERRLKKEVMLEMNSLLSLSEASLETPKLNTGGFIQKDIMKFFEKYKHVKGIGNCFKN